MASMKKSKMNALRLLAVSAALCMAASSASAEVNSLTARYLANGQIDPGFNGSGFFIGTASGHDVLNDVVTDSNGRAVVCGHVTDGFGNWQNVVGRFNANGTVDTSFGFLGLAWLTLSTASTATACAINPANGRILVAVETGVLGGAATPNMVLASLTSGGQLDTGFGGGTGFVTLSLPGAAHAWPVDVRVSGGKVIVAGDLDNVAAGVNNEAFVARFHGNGAPDVTFDGDGLFRSSLGFSNIAIRGMDADGIGRPVLVGSAGAQTLIARLTTAGIPDPAFDNDGKRQFSFPGQVASEARSVFTSGSTITLAGIVAYTVNGPWSPSVMRLLDGGAGDPSFANAGGWAVVSPTTLPGSTIVNDIARSPVNGDAVLTAANKVGSGLYSLTLLRFTTAGILKSSGGVVITPTTVNVHPLAVWVDGVDRATITGYLE